MKDFSKELNFKTSRSSGAGGQNVNKVETAVTVLWHVDDSGFFDENEKVLIQNKLKNRINAEGFLQVRSQTHRTQLANKEEVTEKINQLVYDSLKKKKARIATKPGKQAKEKRLEWKKRNAETKSGRRKLKPGEY